MRVLKLSTARSIVVFMTDATDRVTGKTGLTLTITASKDGAAFASISPTVTELASGWYKLALTSSHTDTAGDLALHITGTGADPTDVLMQVVAYDMADAAGLGLSSVAAIKAKTDNLPSDPADQSLVEAAIAGMSVDLSPVQTVVDAIKLKTDNLPSDPADQSLIMAGIAAAQDAVQETIYTIPMEFTRATPLLLPFEMRDDVTHLPATGLSPVVYISEDGGAFVVSTNTAVEIGNGAYKIQLTDQEMDARSVLVRLTAPDALEQKVFIRTTEWE